MLLFFDLFCLATSWDVLGLPWEDKLGQMERDYTTTDLQSIVDDVANQFHIERDRIDSFFRSCKYHSSVMQIFHRFDMKVNNDNIRTLYYGATVMKIRKFGNTYRVYFHFMKIFEF